MTHGDHSAGEATGEEQGSNEEGSPVLLRKSCDLCVRLKRACDGKSPCHLCMRRREKCTRSVKKKSGPAKGTKYTTRRKRLEAGIAEPTPAKSRGNKAKVGVSGIGVGDGVGCSVGGRKSDRTQMSFTQDPPLSADHATSNVREGYPVAGISNSRLGRVTNASATETLRDVDATGRSRRSPAEFPSSEPLSDRRWTTERESESTAAIVGDEADRQSSSPLSISVLSRPPTTLSAPSHFSRGSVGDRCGRGQAGNPYGLLPGPPAVVGKPRRGGTREPPVEATAGTNHFRGPPHSKRHRMSPLFPPRESLLGPRTDDVSLGVPICSENDSTGMTTAATPEDLRTLQRAESSTTFPFPLSSQPLYNSYPATMATSNAFNGSEQQVQSIDGRVTIGKDVGLRAGDEGTSQQDWGRPEIRLLPPPISAYGNELSIAPKNFGDDHSRIEDRSSRWRGLEGAGIGAAADKQSSGDAGATPWDPRAEQMAKVASGDEHRGEIRPNGDIVGQGSDSRGGGSSIKLEENGGTQVPNCGSNHDRSAWDFNANARFRGNQGNAEESDGVAGDVNEGGSLCSSAGVNLPTSSGWAEDSLAFGGNGSPNSSPCGGGRHRFSLPIPQNGPNRGHLLPPVEDYVRNKGVSSITGVAGSGLVTHGNGRGSPFGSFRGLSAPIDSYHGSSPLWPIQSTSQGGASPPDVYFQCNTEGDGAGGGVSDGWHGDGQEGAGSFLESGAAVNTRGREPLTSKGSGSERWQQPWGATQGRRSSFEREATNWPPEYSI